ncbi:hypothetical protein HDV00_004501 [Rhizophlyctis rosea]|nr:hypothetical protein HDV00_004501 [Rhizophlyctis rosea]
MVLTVAIIGAGPGGLCAAIQLKQRLGNRVQYTIYEKSGKVGGTCFELNPEWSRTYCRQEEIQQYFERTAEKYGVIPNVRFHTKWLSSHWEEKRYKWKLRLQTVDPVSSTVTEICPEYDVLISAIGSFTIPAYPKIANRTAFKGQAFHSAEWNHGANFNGKRVVIVGTAASAVQIVPEIAPKVASLTVFQRTPNWITPKAEYEFPPISDLLISNFRPTFLSFLTTLRATHHMKRTSPPHLHSALIPTHTYGCKRPLPSSTYLPALSLPHVILITTPISHFTDSGLADTSGTIHPADVVIFATGYKVQTAQLSVEVVGKGGRSVKQKWVEGKETDRGKCYLGTCLNGFPNYYVVLGPNVGVGHTSILGMMECQVNFICNILDMMTSKWVLRTGAEVVPWVRSVEVTEEAESKYFEGIQEVLKDSVWAKGGCSSWYMNSQGQVTVLWPWTVSKFWWVTRRVNWGDFEVVRAETKAVVDGGQGLPILKAKL